jgi:hypothetical protein
MRKAFFAYEAFLYPKRSRLFVLTLLLMVMMLWTFAPTESQGGGSLTVTVRDASGIVPLPDVAVVAVSPQYPRNAVGGCTDANGMITLSNLVVGATYYIRAGDNYRVLFSNVWTDCSEIRYVRQWYNNGVQIGNVPSSISLNLEPGGTISGRVFAQDGTTPVTSASVVLDIPGGDRFGPETFVRSDGTYTLGHIPFNTPITVRAFYAGMGQPQRGTEWWYNAVTPDLATTITLTAANATRADIDFSLAEAASISGRVFDTAGMPLAGGPVRISGAEARLIACTDAEGRYRIGELQVGESYRISAGGSGSTCSNNSQPQEWYNSAQNAGEALVLTVPPDDLNNIDFRLGPLRLLTPSGTIGTVTAQQGNPLYSWDDTGADVYQIVVYREENFVPPHNNFEAYALLTDSICSNGTCSVDLTTNPTLNEDARLYNGRHIVWLRADQTGGWAGPFPFTLNAAPPNPISGFTIQNPTAPRPTLAWNTDGNATAFRVYVAPVENFPNNPVVNELLPRASACGSLSGTTCTFPIPLDLPEDGSYYAFINVFSPGGFSAGGTYGNGWEGGQFTVDSIPNPAIPSNVAVNINQGRPSISWTTDANATRHMVYIYSSAANNFVFFRQYEKTGDSRLVCSSTCTLIDDDMIFSNGQYIVFVNATGGRQQHRGDVEQRLQRRHQLYAEFRRACSGAAGQHECQLQRR